MVVLPEEMGLAAKDINVDIVTTIGNDGPVLSNAQEN